MSGTNKRLCAECLEQHISAEPVPAVWTEAVLRPSSETVRTCVKCGDEHPMRGNHDMCPQCHGRAAAIRRSCTKCGKACRGAKTPLCGDCRAGEPGESISAVHRHFERIYRKGKLGKKPSRSLLAGAARELWYSLTAARQELLKKDLRVYRFDNQYPFEALVDYAQETVWAVSAETKRGETSSPKREREGRQKPSSSVWTVSGGLPTLGKGQ